MELLEKLLDKKASEDNTICLNAYAQGIIDSKASEMLEMLKQLVLCSEDGYISAYEGGYKDWETEFAEKLSKAKKLIDEATNV